MMLRSWAASLSFLSHSSNWNTALIIVVKRHLTTCTYVSRINLGTEEGALPGAELSWEVAVETEARAVWRGVQRALARYRDERAGPTLLALQARLSPQALLALMPGERAAQIYVSLCANYPLVG